MAATVALEKKTRSENIKDEILRRPVMWPEHDWADAVPQDLALDLRRRTFALRGRTVELFGKAETYDRQLCDELAVWKNPESVLAVSCSPLVRKTPVLPAISARGVASTTQSRRGSDAHSEAGSEFMQ